MDLKIKWDKDKYREFREYLFKIRDIKYRDFQKKLTFSKYEIIGIKIPELRKISKEIFKGDYKSFLKIADNKYFEIVLIKGLVIASINSLEEINNYFLPFVDLIDDWAICDTWGNSLKIINKNKEYFKNIIDSLIKTGQEYKMRLGLVLLLFYYKEEEYLDYIYLTINKTESDFYYTNMARAWLLCECFIRYPKKTLKYLEKNKLDKFTINKAISKIRDSYRVSIENKEYLLRYKK